MLVDSHAHYDDSRFDNDRDIIIREVYSKGINRIINPSSDMGSVKTCLELSGEYPFVYAAVGVHPHYCDELDDSDMQRLAELAKDTKVVAVGEIGLDYYYENSPRDIQKHWFCEQIKLANELNLPIIIHNRDAHKDTLEIVSRYCQRQPAGVFHMFSGSVEMAEQVVKLGFYIGIGGVVTFKNTRKITEVVKAVPEDRMLVETDCPYMAPEPFRGRRNDSGMLRCIVEKIAEIRNCTYECVAKATYENAVTLFGL